jgi:hypothetical protein
MVGGNRIGGEHRSTSASFLEALFTNDVDDVSRDNKAGFGVTGREGRLGRSRIASSL